MPPPKVVKLLVKANEKIAASPKKPTFWPFIVAPKPWAQSSITNMFLLLAIAASSSAGAGQPYMWVIIIAETPSQSSSLIVSGPITQLP